AWAKLKSLPAIQMALSYIELRQEYTQFMEIYQLPENQELVKVLGDMASQEIFVSGDKNFIDFIDLLKLVGNQVNAGGSKNPAANMLRHLAKNADRIKAPGLIIGFKLSKTEPATAQLTRLENFIKPLAEQQPFLQGRIKRVTAVGGDFLTLELDGSMIPWEN